MSEHSLDWPYKATFDGELDVSAGLKYHVMLHVRTFVSCCARRKRKSSAVLDR